MNFLVVNDILPQEDRGGSELRLIQLLRILREQGHDVTYIARYGSDAAYSLPALEQLGLRVFAHDCERLRYFGVDSAPQWSFEQILVEEHFDFAILCNWFWSGISVPEHYMCALRELAPVTRIAVLTDDVHSLRERRLAAVTGLNSDLQRAEDYHFREFEIYRRADIVLSISEFDRDNLLANSPELKIQILPIAAGDVRCGPDFCERKAFLYLGNFENDANKHSISWFLTKVWPSVRHAMRDAELHVVGYGALDTLSQPEIGVFCHGQVRDLRPYFDGYRVFVSPLRFATGIPTKNLLALSNGLPVVTSTMGAEGLSLRHGTTALIADSAAEFAEFMVSLHTNGDLWRRLSSSGCEYASSNFSLSSLRDKMADLITLMSRTGINSQPCLSWSCLDVEKRFPEVLSFPRLRLMRRCFAYLTMAEELIAGGKHREAQIQARHVFSFFRNHPLNEEPYRRAFEVLSKCNVA
jgi:glycosyltransferase involved in cell wall biosynthesis